MIKKLVYHPLLFAIFPVLFLYARNMEEYPLDVLWLPIGTYLLIAIAGWGVASLTCWNIEKGALLVSLFLAIFTSYGHIYNLLWSLFRDLRKPPLGVDLLLFPLCLLLFILISAAIIRGQQDLSKVTRALNIASAALVSLSLVTIAFFAVKYRRSPHFQQGNAAVSLHDAVPGPKPNIYYIVLDGYPRQDNLRQLYQEDNSSFIKQLRRRGFFVAGKSYSNYSHTLQSLAASLNFNYLDNLAALIGDGNKDRAPLRKMIARSEVRAFLARQGYQFVTVKSGYRNTEISEADIYLSAGYSSDFQIALSRLTPLHAFRLFFGLDEQDCQTCRVKAGHSQNGVRARDRERILFPFKNIPRIANHPLPIFVLAHIVAPHAPFVFRENGEETDFQPHLSFENGNWLIKEGGLTRRQFINYFRQQLRFINKKVLALVDAIISTSAKPPIIILQGDHGPGAFVHHDSLQNTYLQDRLGILNAYLLPRGGEGVLPDNVSPVNSFRVIFNEYFSTQLPLLPNRYFYSTATFPYRFYDVTDLIGGEEDQKRLHMLRNHDYFPKLDLRH